MQDSVTISFTVIIDQIEYTPADAPPVKDGSYIDGRIRVTFEGRDFQISEHVDDIKCVILDILYFLGSVHSNQSVTIPFPSLPLQLELARTSLHYLMITMIYNNRRRDTLSNLPYMAFRKQFVEAAKEYFSVLASKTRAINKKTCVNAINLIESTFFRHDLQVQ